MYLEQQIVILLRPRHLVASLMWHPRLQSRWREWRVLRQLRLQAHPVLVVLLLPLVVVTTQYRDHLRCGCTVDTVEAGLGCGGHVRRYAALGEAREHLWARGHAVGSAGSVGSGRCGQWVVAVGNVGLHTCAARKPRMPSERTLGEAGRDRIPASASVQGLSVCMNGKALGDEHNASRCCYHGCCN